MKINKKSCMKRNVLMCGGGGGGKGVLNREVCVGYTVSNVCTTSSGSSSSSHCMVMLMAK